MADRVRPLARKEPGALTVALQMREAVGYLASLASRSDFDAVARKLLGVHLELGVKIAALTDEERPTSLDSETKLRRH